MKRKPEPEAAIPLEVQLAAARDWKHIGIALAAGAGGLEAMIEAQIEARKRGEPEGPPRS